MNTSVHIGFALFPDVTQLDFTGPAQVLARVPGAKIHLAWKRLEPVMTDVGFTVNPTVRFDECPQLDVLCVPGGPGVFEQLADPAMLLFLRAQAANARYVTSVCNGSLVLAAAGLLNGYRSACHWLWRDYLAEFGAQPDDSRVVHDRNRFSGAGVTSGIDFAFTLLAELAGEDYARTVQLRLEYDPRPPFDSGSPGKAGAERVAGVRAAVATQVRAMEPLIKQAASLSQDVWDRPQTWLNPGYGVTHSALRIPFSDVRDADARLTRCAPLLMQLFPETRETEGIIESPLVPLHGAFYGQSLVVAGSAWIKCDHALPVAGSIKARGGIHEVLEFAERVAFEHGLLVAAGQYETLASAKAKDVFSKYEVLVGSTGNLGMSIGLISAALGFRATVHMSSEAKDWKKQRLRAGGVQVVEHAGDYAQAVTRARLIASQNANGYFVDDERSPSLFVGYAVAAIRFAQQAKEAGIQVDAEHPLFVYLPCGVGGAPSGVAFGLKEIFGQCVHCFFVEPTASPCFLVRMRHPDRPGITVYDVGLDNRTEADGLAVPAASELAVDQMRGLLSGVMTTDDDTMFGDLYRLHTLQSLRIEPSAAAAFSGPRALLGSMQGQAYLRRHGLDAHMGNSHHVLWSTGGLFVPEQEFGEFLERGRRSVGAADGAIHVGG